MSWGSQVQFLYLLTVGMCKVFTVASLGFDWNFNSIQDESNELFRAYRDMFEVAISQASLIRSMVTIYAPLIWRIFVSFSGSSFNPLTY